jgi:hypothetical protein
VLPPGGFTSVCSWKNVAVCDRISAAAISAAGECRTKRAKSGMRDQLQ